MCSTTSTASVGRISPVRILRGDGDWLEDSLLLAKSILSASFAVVAAGLVSLEIVIALFPFVGALPSLPCIFRAHCDFDDALLCLGFFTFRKVLCGEADGFKLWVGEELGFDMCWGPEYTSGKLLNPSGALREARACAGAAVKASSKFACLSDIFRFAFHGNSK